MGSNDNDQARALAIHPLHADQIAPLSPIVAAEHFVRSGYFKDASDVSKAVVKILYGAEFNIPPVTAMLNIHVVEGKPSMGAHMIGALLRRAGYDFRVVENTNQVCRIVFFRQGERLGESEFTWEDAVRAELAGKANWRHYPKAMLFARAISQGARMHIPDAFLGSIYTPDELGAEVTLDSDGNIETARDVTPAPPSTPAEPKLPPIGVTSGQLTEIRLLSVKLGWGEEALCEKLQIDGLNGLTTKRAGRLIERLKDLALGGKPTDETDAVETDTDVLRSHVAGELRRLKLSVEVGNALHAIVLPDHEAETPLSVEQAERLLTRLRKFKDADAVATFVDIEQDMCRKPVAAPVVEVMPGGIKRVVIPEFENPKWAQPEDELFAAETVEK